MKLYLLLFALSMLSLTACIKSDITTTYTGPVTSCDLDGKFGPFGKGSTWEYQYIQCDSNNSPICTPALISFTHGEPYPINKYEMVDLYGQVMHISDGKYYKSYGNALITMLVENPTVGMTWVSETDLADDLAVHMPITYQFRVVAVGSSLTIAAGTFNNVVELEAIITGYEAGSAHYYYQEGVGLLKEVYNRTHNYSRSYELVSYNIQ